MPAVGRLVFRVHAVERMFERRVTASDVRYVLEHGQIVEQHQTARRIRLGSSSVGSAGDRFT